MAAQSFVKAMQTCFGASGGKKLSIQEFRELTNQDKEELRDMLIADGFDVEPLAGATS